MSDSKVSDTLARVQMVAALKKRQAETRFGQAQKQHRNALTQRDDQARQLEQALTAERDAKASLLRARSASVVSSLPHSTPWQKSLARATAETSTRLAEAKETAAKTAAVMGETRSALAKADHRLDFVTTAQAKAARAERHQAEQRETDALTETVSARLSSGFEGETPLTAAPSMATPALRNFLGDLVAAIEPVRTGAAAEAPSGHRMADMTSLATQLAKHPLVAKSTPVSEQTLTLLLTHHAAPVQTAVLRRQAGGGVSVHLKGTAQNHAALRATAQSLKAFLGSQGRNDAAITITVG